MPNSASTNGTFDRAEAITKAAVRAADALGLNQSKLSAALGLSPLTLRRIRSGVYSLQPGTKSWDMALLLVRLFHGLDRELAGDEQSVRTWMMNLNLELDGTPVDLIAQRDGLARVVAYVEGYNSRS
jgi:hypothetical protein